MNRVGYKAYASVFAVSAGRGVVCRTNCRMAAVLYPHPAEYKVFVLRGSFALFPLFLFFGNFRLLERKNKMLKFKNNHRLFMCGIVLLIMQFITLAVRAVSYAVVKGTPLTFAAIKPTSPERFALFWGLGVIGIIVLIISVTVKLGDELCQEERLSPKKRTMKLVMCALLLSLAGVVSLVEIMPIQEMKITFTFIFIALCGYLYGPTTGMAFGASADIIGYIINPAGGMLFPGFTVTALISGFFYGLVLNREYSKNGKLPVWRIITAKVLDTVVCNIILNTFCCSVLYGDTFVALLPARLIKNLIMLPVEILILILIISFFEKYTAKYNVNI